MKAPILMKHMFTLIFPFLFLLPFSTFSQSKTSFGLVLGAHYSYRSVFVAKDRTSNIAFLSTLVHDRDSLESPKFNPRIELSLNRRLWKGISLKLGVSFSSMGYKGGSSDYIERWDLVNLWGESGPVTPSPSEVHYKIDYVLWEMVWGIKLNLGKQACKPFLELGILPSLYLATRMHYESRRGTDISYTQNFPDAPTKLHLGAYAAIGASYRVSKTTSLFAQLNGRQHFSQTANSPIQEKLFSVGMEGGIRKSL